MTTHTKNKPQRYFVVADEEDPGSEAPSYEAACKDLDALRAQGASDPRILVFPTPNTITWW